MKKLCILFFTFFVFIGVFAQNKSFIAMGDKAFKDADYYKAAYYYKMAADKKSTAGSIPFYSGGKIEKAKIKNLALYVRYRLAESYRLYFDYRDARDVYRGILDENANAYPLARLWYGECLRTEARFDEALTELQQFKATYEGDREFVDAADREIASCNLAKRQYAGHKPIKVIKMQGQWNAGAGDYAITKNADNYWFTSSRLTGNNKTHSNNVFIAASQNSFVPQLVNFSRVNINGDIEYGTPSIAPSGKKLYLTNWYKKGNKTILAIYYSVLQSNEWSQPVKLNNFVNADGFNAMQPCVTRDGKHLFFVSDRPGGQGGYDIWMSDLDENGEPVNALNLGKTVNTSSDEEAPFYDEAHKRLVFSSKGFSGLGGFDFFESYGDGTAWSAPANLRYPINSVKDDLYYYANPDDTDKFYISSDRESDCCLNLFELRYLPSVITGKIIDCDSNRALSDVTVSLSDSVSGKILDKTVTSANGEYAFKLLKTAPLSLLIEKNGYFEKTVAIAGDNDTAAIPGICLAAFKINKPIVIKNILYDFNSAELRPASKTALDDLVKIMRDNPAIKIELGSHTDSIGSDSYNLNLSERRAKSCVDYLLSKGISNNRVVAKGYGKSMPVAPNSLPGGGDNPAGRELNRRTEFIVKEQ